MYLSLNTIFSAFTQNNKSLLQLWTSNLGQQY